jgi:hypothetical protein
MTCPPGKWCSAGRAFDCGVDTYANESKGLRTTQADCIPCGPNSQTNPTSPLGASSVTACGCDPGFFRNASGVCQTCPLGAACSDWNTTSATLQLEKGYWRASATSADLHSCPTPKLCLGNKDAIAPNASVCGAGIDPTVPYCTHCLAYPEQYLDFDSGKCEPCSGPRYGLLAYSSAVLLLLAAAAVLPRCMPDMWRVRLRMIRALLLRIVRHASIMAKGKQLLGFYQIVTHLYEVYGVVLPPHVQSLQTRLDLFNLNVLTLPGLQMQCFGLHSFASRLLARALVPLVLILASVGFHWWRRTLERALPFTLWLTFLVFSSVSSPAFQAFSCEAFDNDRISFLRADVFVVCSEGGHEPPAYTQLKVLAGIIIVLYPVGVPVMYFALLVGLRWTSISSSLSFLTANYRPQYYW